MICLHFAPIDNAFSSVVELFEIISRQKTNENKEKFASANTEVFGSVQALIKRMERLLKERVMCTDYPEFVARFYDVIYKKVRTGTDHDYYMKKIFESDGPVLEVGVGTGRFFSEALEKGADIYGIDISRNMIERLKEKLDKRYHSRVFIQDVVNMSIEKEFDLIIAPFRVFSHIIKVKD